MRSPKVLGIVLRFSLLLLQLVYKLKNLLFLFHAPTQVTFIQNLDFALLHLDGVFDLLDEENFFQNVLEHIEFDLSAHSDWLLAEYFSLILFRYWNLEILAKFDEVTLDDFLVILLHIFKSLTLKLYRHVLLSIKLEDLLKDLHLPLPDRILVSVSGFVFYGP